MTAERFCTLSLRTRPKVDSSYGAKMLLNETRCPKSLNKFPNWHSLLENDIREGSFPRTQCDVGVATQVRVIEEIPSNNQLVECGKRVQRSSLQKEIFPDSATVYTRLSSLLLYATKK